MSICGPRLKGPGILTKITLKDHSYTVANNIVEIVRETLNYENLVPRAIITALAHDLGKIPEYSESGSYCNTHEHTLIGTAKLKELASGMKIL